MEYKFTLIFLIFTNFCYSQIDSINSEYLNINYSIIFPKTWKLDTSNVMGTEFCIYSPLENDNDKFSENINAIIQDLKGQNIGLKEYKEISEKQFNTSNCTIFESKIIKKQSNEYYSATYSMNQSNFKLKITSFCYIKNEKAYLISFTSEIEKYNKYKKVGEKILESFKLIN